MIVFLVLIGLVGLALIIYGIIGIYRKDKGAIGFLLAGVLPILIFTFSLLFDIPISFRYNGAYQYVGIVSASNELYLPTTMAPMPAITDGTTTQTGSVTEITLNRSTLTMLTGNTENLHATIEPWGAESDVTWQSSNQNIATIAQTRNNSRMATLTAVSPGSATITATSVAGGFNVSAVVTVTDGVTIQTGNVTEITLNRNTLTMLTGNTENLHATIEPWGVESDVTWQSSNQNVATITPTRNNSRMATLTAVSPGTATITATSVAGGFTVSAVVTVAP